MRAIVIGLTIVLGGCSNWNQVQEKADSWLMDTEVAYCDAQTMGAVRRRCASEPEWCQKYNDLCSRGLREPVVSPTPSSSPSSSP